MLLTPRIDSDPGHSRQLQFPSVDGNCTCKPAERHSDPQQFIAKWQRVTLSERSACQQHFLDLCELLASPSRPTPTRWYLVYLREGVQTAKIRRAGPMFGCGSFRLGVQRKHKDSRKPTRNCNATGRRREPALMVVCDMDRFESTRISPAPPSMSTLRSCWPRPTRKHRHSPSRLH